LEILRIFLGFGRPVGTNAKKIFGFQLVVVSVEAFHTTI
jgi:hypothetical protein